jgi:hypothetical protein
VEAEARKEPTANEGTCDSYEQVTDDPEPGALHDLAGQPSGNETDHQYDQETFTRHVHLRILSIHQTARQIPTPSRKRKAHHQRRAWPKVKLRFFRRRGMILLFPR